MITEIFVISFTQKAELPVNCEKTAAFQNSLITHLSQNLLPHEYLKPIITIN